MHESIIDTGLTLKQDGRRNLTAEVNPYSRITCSTKLKSSEARLAKEISSLFCGKLSSFLLRQSVLLLFYRNAFNYRAQSFNLSIG
jgi:hypothetical protein